MLSARVASGPLVACLLLSCAHSGAPAAKLQDAAKEAQLPRAPAQTLALAGFHALLMDGDAETALSRFNAALDVDAHNAYGLRGRMLLSQRSGHPERIVSDALLLLEQGIPTHPLQATAARELLERVGQSLELDAEVTRRAPNALRRGLLGEAAHLLRTALATIASERGDLAQLTRLRLEMGTPTAFTWMGPFSAHRTLEFDVPLGPQQNGSLEGSFKGPFGPLSPRTLEFPDGRIQLSGEPALGDVHLLAFDVEAEADALHVVRAVSDTSHEITLDGTPLLSRRGFMGNPSAVASVAVPLSKGRHRLVIKMLLNDRRGLALSLPRADGAPANLRFSPATGPAPRWDSPRASLVPSGFPSAVDLAKALAPEVGDALANFLAAHDGATRDREGAKALLDAAATTLASPTLSVLRAELTLTDPNLPVRVSRGRVTHDLDSALEKDPKHVDALLMRAALALEDSRFTEATDLLQRARVAEVPVGYPVRMLEARLGLGLNVDSQADVATQHALAAQPKLCDALSLRFELAQRHEAVQKANALLPEVQQCPNGLSRAVEYARTRGGLAQAIGWAETLVAREPTSVAATLRLAGLYSAKRRTEDALKAIRKLQTIWPRDALLRKREGDVLAEMGDAKGALAAREAALLLDGSDLSLRRNVERAKTGKEPLEETAIDARTAIAEYQAQPGTEDAAGAYVLDAAATRAYPDGSSVDRIHVIQKVLDQSAIAEMAEVSIPQGAHVLTLRTLKADGRVLEPENLQGKDTVSLPSVAVGDFVEYEYILAHGSRGPALPGFTAANFYFQIARQPDQRVTYTVVAPKGAGLKVDAHQMIAPQPETRNNEEVFHLTLRRVPPLIPEPDSAPSGNEYLPFVSVGAGTQGPEPLMTAYGDVLLDRARLTHEVIAFAQEAAQGKSGDALVDALYNAVMQRISGRDEGLGVSAAATLAQDRGSRLWLLKAALEAAGVQTRVALARPFSVDPAPYLFPNEMLFAYALLKVSGPGVSERWLDATVRFTPLGYMPEQVAGGREAFLLPEPGRPLKRALTPTLTEFPGKEVKLDLNLELDGTLAGSGQERYSGLEAAQLADALDSLAPHERNQALQSALSRYFSGAELSELRVDREAQVGAPLQIFYRLRIPGFARREDNKLLLPPITFPAWLGRRYVQLSQRQTPLFIAATERNSVKVSLKIPPGVQLSGIVANVKTGSRFGYVHRRERQEEGQVLIEEDYRLEMARISPRDYDEFSQFAGEVDLLQSRDLVFQLPAVTAPKSAAR